MGQPSTATRALALVACALALFTARCSSTLLRNDLEFTPLDTELSFWGRENYQPTQAMRAAMEAQIPALLARPPGHPDYLLLRASQLEWEAYWKGDESLAKQANQSRFLALQQRPTDARVWRQYRDTAIGIGAEPAQVAFAESQLAALRR